MSRKSKKTLSIGKKLKVKTGRFHCKVELPTLASFKSLDKKVSPYQMFYTWLGKSLEPNNEGRLLEILFKDTLAKLFELNQSRSIPNIDRKSPLMDCTKIVVNPRVLKTLNDLQGAWALKFKHVSKGGLELYMSLQNLAYGPSSESSIPENYVYVKPGVFFFIG